MLSIRVHLAAVREQEIRRDYDVRSRRRLSTKALGLPLNITSIRFPPRSRRLPSPPTFRRAVPGGGRRKTGQELSNRSSRAKPRNTRPPALERLCSPHFAVRGAFEADRQEFVNKGGANWLISASMRWNLFDGNDNRARIAEAQAWADTARAQGRAAEQAVRLEVFRSWADLRASAPSASRSLGRGQRRRKRVCGSLKNRYESGLATVTDLLRNETALLESRTRRLAAIHDQRLAAAQLELAAGTLSPDSELLRSNRFTPLIPAIVAIALAGCGGQRRDS